MDDALVVTGTGDDSFHGGSAANTLRITTTFVRFPWFGQRSLRRMLRSLAPLTARSSFENGERVYSGRPNGSSVLVIINAPAKGKRRKGKKEKAQRVNNG